ncbi:hypothetical protein RB195_010806 [Necator americanus]|uniref:Uncharacterized protein n=1 Tax=Necator americanus TaxID=51031 RepID=A0ABR1CZI8_NECAM
MIACLHASDGGRDFSIRPLIPSSPPVFPSSSFGYRLEPPTWSEELVNRICRSCSSRFTDSRSIGSSSSACDALQAPKGLIPARELMASMIPLKHGSNDKGGLFTGLPGGHVCPRYAPLDS